MKMVESIFPKLLTMEAKSKIITIRHDFIYSLSSNIFLLIFILKFKFKLKLNILFNKCVIFRYRNPIEIAYDILCTLLTLLAWILCFGVGQCFSQSDFMDFVF